MKDVENLSIASTEINVNKKPFTVKSALRISELPDNE